MVGHHLPARHRGQSPTPDRNAGCGHRRWARCGGEALFPILEATRRPWVRGRIPKVQTWMQTSACRRPEPLCWGLTPCPAGMVHFPASRFAGQSAGFRTYPLWPQAPVCRGPVPFWAVGLHRNPFLGAGMPEALSPFPSLCAVSVLLCSPHNFSA